MSREQIDAALKSANEVRAQRAVLRARVRPLDPQDGRYELAAILDEGHHEALARLPIVGFLKWSKRMLPEMIRRYLAESGCSEFKVIGDMSPRQRTAMAAALRLSLEQMRERDRERAMEKAAKVWAQHVTDRKAAA